MTRSASLPAISLALITALATGCASNSRQLRSISVTPASADAKNFPNGQVRFAATGTYNVSPSPVPLTSKDVTWCVGFLINEVPPVAGACTNSPQPFAAVDSNGVAQCSANSQGTVYILAGTPMLPNMNPAFTTLKVWGAAQLTCP